MQTLEKPTLANDGFEFPVANIYNRIREIIDYLFYLVYGMIGLVIVLDLTGASDSSGFKQFLNKITYPLLGGFVGMFPDPIVQNRFRLRFSYIAALFIYLLLHIAIYGLIRLIDRRRWRF